VWIKEGSIIPLLNFEQGRMSLLEAINDPVNLLIYPTVIEQFDLGIASGDLYLDDGENNNYLNNECTQVKFSWANSQLTIMKTLTDDNQYPKASGKFINKAQIFNVIAAPDRVRNSYVSDTDGQIETNIEFIYNDKEQSLTLHNFFIPVDSALVYMKPVVLWEIFWV
jgi:alpha-glucosidase (family GH31 glycosyl hydrolase)